MMFPFLFSLKSVSLLLVLSRLLDHLMVESGGLNLAPLLSLLVLLTPLVISSGVVVLNTMYRLITLII